MFSDFTVVSLVENSCGKIEIKATIKLISILFTALTKISTMADNKFRPAHF
jgi:hypothetical protein